jgi:hypothetical protein
MTSTLMERGAGGRLNKFSTDGTRNASVLPVPAEVAGVRQWNIDNEKYTQQTLTVKNR